jgi:hypothetical protein
MTELDTNGDYTASHDDDVADYKIDLLATVCDTNNDGSTDSCELYACMIEVENLYRDIFCSEYH